jgi:superfamily II DNA or RNA helicase
MNISDFIPSYPYIEDPEFNRKISNLKEFNDIEEGSLRWRHQELVTRYAGPHTAYDRHLIYHTPGTGKTCAAVDIIEDTFKHNPDIKRAVIVVPNETLIQQWKDSIAFICSGKNSRYIPEHYYSTDPENELSDQEKKNRLNKEISRFYTLETYEKFQNNIRKGGYTNTIVVIDEAHNIKLTLYDDYYNFLHRISKVILLTGTPMIDNAKEIAGLLNLLLPVKDKIDPSTFDKTYLKNGKLIEDKANDLEPKIRGMVSYVTSNEDFPTKEAVGELWEGVTNYIKVYKTEMSDFQTEGYLAAWKQYQETIKGPDEKKYKKDRDTVYLQTIAALTFIYYSTAKKRYIWGTDVTVMEDPKTKEVINKDALMNQAGTSIRPKYVKDLKENLAKYSSKLAAIVKIAQDNPKDPIFVYNDDVSGAQGCIFQSAVLRDVFGIKTDYMIGTNATKHDRIKKRFNDITNRDASNLQVLFGSRTVGTGLSLINAKHAIIVTPHWNISTTDQALARAIRADSLNWLPKSERIIKTYYLVADNPKIDVAKNTDAIILKHAESKDVAIKSVERFLKKVAWDCKLNYKTNYVAGIANSRECDYDDCEWKCYGFPENESSESDADAEDEDESESESENDNAGNWILFYSEDRKKILEKTIIEFFQKNSVIDINEITNNNPIDKKLIILILEDFIVKNKTIRNRYGVEVYIRYDGEYLYLSDNLNNEQISDVWYTDKPYINRYTTLTEIVDRDTIKNDNITCDDPYSMKSKTRVKTAEILYVLNITKPNEKISEALEKFSKDFFTIDGTAVHTLEKYEGGPLRIYDSSEKIWRDSDKNESSKYNKKIKEYSVVSVVSDVSDVNDVSDIVNNIYKAYIKYETGETKLVLNVPDKDDKDARKNVKGSTVKSVKKYELMNLAPTLGLDELIRIAGELSIDIPTKNIAREKMIAELETKSNGNYAGYQDNVEKYYRLSLLTGPDLFKIIEQFFIEKGLTVGQK